MTIETKYNIGDDDMDIKELIKERLNQLSKEELVDALANVCVICVSSNITKKLNIANCIQQCKNNVQTNLQQVRMY